MTVSRRPGSPKARARARSVAKGGALDAGRSVKGGTYKTAATSALSQASSKASNVRSKRAPSSGAGTDKPRPKQQRAWPLQDAKARFSELVRRVKVEGPQQVSVHGKVEVVVVSADEFRRLKGERTGAALIAALQASPQRDVELAPSRAPMPVRTVEL
jgi:prevent-host-death family protein